MLQTHSIEMTDLTRDEIGEIAPNALIALSVGAIEQHGVHLPISTDHEIGVAVTTEAARRANETVSVLIAPEIAYGFSHHHKPHPGVVSLNVTTLIKCLQDIVESFVESGFRRIAMVNSHGGNREALGIVARDISNRYPVSIAAVDAWTAGTENMENAGVFKTVSRSLGHGDALETSLMYHLRPDLIDPASFPDALPPSKKINGARIFVGETRQGLTAGHRGEPRQATPELGALIYESIVAGLAKCFIALHQSRPQSDKP